MNSTGHFPVFCAWPQHLHALVVDQVLDLLRTRKRVTYGAIQRQFELDDAILEELKTELLFAHPQASDQEGVGLVWNDAEKESTQNSSSSELSEPFPTQEVRSVQSAPLTLERQTPEANVANSR